MSSRILEIVTLPPRRGIKIRCKCGHKWTYCGNSLLFASCPRCHTTNTLQPKRKKPLPQPKDQEDKKPLRTAPTVGSQVEQSRIVSTKTTLVESDSDT
jgi:hypothetical protein